MFARWNRTEMARRGGHGRQWPAGGPGPGAPRRRMAMRRPHTPASISECQFHGPIIRTPMYGHRDGHGHGHRDESRPNHDDSESP